MTTTTLAPSFKSASIALTVPVLPDSAPFTAAQRAYLNGFFAGLFSGQPATAPSAIGAASPAAAPTLEDEESFEWHDPAIAIDQRMTLADNRPHERKLMAAMAQLDCGACGYICKTYGEAIARGEEKDLTRCTPGGRDTAKMLKQLVASAPRNVVPASDIRVKKSEPATSPDAPSAWDRGNPYPARLMHSKMLNSPLSTKDTRHVVIDLRSSGITYKPGDALGVFPENCSQLVTDILDALGMTGAEDVPGWDGSPISLRYALAKEFSITRPTPDLIDILSRCAADADECAALQALRDHEDGAGDLQVLDLLRKFPSARPAAGDFVATLSPLAPRLYSISSSQLAHPGQVHLTVGAVRYENSAGRKCGGVASTFLADRIRSGQTVRIFIHPSAKFSLPEGNQPVIMVGPGTGVAPFRAFLQERAAAECKGKNWLFFGDQREDRDFLYRRELEKFQQDGVLTRIDTAFSRDSDKKVYVQHKMIEHGAELFRWLQEGGHFYVCGDAKRMAADVDKALRQLVAEHGQLSPAEADAYVSNLVRGGRYQRDVY